MGTGSKATDQPTPCRKFLATPLYTSDVSTDSQSSSRSRYYICKQANCVRLHVFY